MTVARLLVGDCRKLVADLPDASIDCLITSPPYPWQRSYLPAAHPDKPLEVGQERSPAEALDALLDLMDLLWPKLADHATFWVNLGDVHAGSGGSGGDYDEGGMRAGQARWQGTARIAKGDGNHVPWRGSRPGWPMDQSVCWISHLFGASLAYGRNLLNGREHRQWVTRPPITWCKPSVSPGALHRRFRTATELVVYGGKHQRHYFDLDAVRLPPSGYDRPNLRGNGSRATDVPGQRKNHSDHTCNPAGAPPFNWWLIPTAQYPDAHYAVMPEALVTKPVEAGCPERVCRTCGKPSVRIVEGSYVDGRGNTGNTERDRQGRGRKKESGKLNGYDLPPEKGWERVHRTVGWTDCGHDNRRPGLVLDPFCGTGTVGAVAVGHGRDALLIDLDDRNVDLVRRRLGPFLQLVDQSSTRRPTDVVAVAGGVL